MSRRNGWLLVFVSGTQTIKVKKLNKLSVFFSMPKKVLEGMN